MGIVVTGATGRLGSLVVQDLLDRHDSADLAVVVRDAAKARPLAARGIEIRIADYSDPGSLRSAFRRNELVLLISSNASADNIAQHRAVIDSAAHSRIGLLVYTSILGCRAATSTIARQHQLTEAAIRDSGLPSVMLRNGWYNENYTENLAAAVQTGTILGSAGTGRIASASRRDYAAAAAAVLTLSDQPQAIYELSGDEAWTMEQLASKVADRTGRNISYRNISEDAYRSMMVQAGIPARDAAAVANADTAISRGELAATPGDLRRLIGRPPTTIDESIRQTLPTD